MRRWRGWAGSSRSDTEMLCGACEPVGQHGGGGRPREPWSVAFEHECQSLRYAKAPRAPTPDSTRREGLEMDVLVDRCAGLDVHKDTVMAEVRRPTKDGSGREQEVLQYRTFTAALRELRAWLVAERVSQVAMEATGSYWKPVWHVLEAETGYELLLCNPRHVKNLPGRKTDVADAAWLAQLLECGL